MRGHRGASLAAALAVVWLALALPVVAAGLAVRYRTETHIYLDGGRASGLAVGDRLLVKSGTQTVAELEVEFVAEQSASCKIVSETRRVAPGDAVTRKVDKPRPSPAPPAAATPESPKAAAPPASSVPPATVAPQPAPPKPAHWGRVWGGFSLGYYKVVDDTPSAYSFEQRTARFDLTARDLAGRPLTLTARLRGRQDLRPPTLGPTTLSNDRELRLYELALSYDPPSEAFKLDVGRIGVTRFVGIGYIDGALAEARVFSSLHLGAFGGMRADPAGIETGGLGPKYGMFMRVAPGRRWSRGFEVVAAAVREMGESEVSRDYFSVESRIHWGRRLSLVELAEIDWNRGWRQAASNGRTFQLSRLVLNLNLRMSAEASANLSYDNRRNYRSFLNRTLAESLFDDVLRQGLRGSLYLGKPLALNGSLGGGVRLRAGGDKNTYSAQAALRNGGLFDGRFNAGLDASGYRGASGEGALASARFGRRFQAGHNLDLSYTYSLYRLGDQNETRQDRVTQWIRLSGRLELPRRVYLSSDIEYDRGDDLKGPRAFLELGYRF